jgi:hypothetical protein
MRNPRILKSERAQSLVELAVAIPLILLLMIGAVEVVFFGRAYLAILEATVVSSRLGSAGATFYDNNEILAMTDQVLSREGYTSIRLVDVIITRAELVNGTTVQNYQASNMLHSGRTPHITAALLQSRMKPGDPTMSVVGVEVYYDHRLVFGGFKILPDPLVLSAYTINALPK